MKKYLIFDLDGTLIDSSGKIKKAILGTIKKFTPEYFLKAQDLYLNYGSLPLQLFLEKVYVNNGLQNRIGEEIMYCFSLINENIEFFPGVLEKIFELSKKYKLFLTTSCSTNVAKNKLLVGGIFDYFEIVYGSDEVHKSVEHLEYFKNYSCDEDFYNRTIYIGDGNNDRVLAKAKNIDFIHIGNEKKDKYEINSVIEIESILKLFN